jgi:hypothetical protein
MKIYHQVYYCYVKEFLEIKIKKKERRKILIFSHFNFKIIILKECEKRMLT